MDPAPNRTSAVAEVLRRQTFVSLPQLMAALGTANRRTVVRAPSKLPKLTSGSHSRPFYALAESARFNEHGRWSIRDIHFSAHGSLRASIETLVRDALAGRFAAELAAVLQDATCDALRYPVRLARQKFAGRFLDLAPGSNRRQARSAPGKPFFRLTMQRRPM